MEISKKWCIYQITNQINGKTYVGQHRYTDDTDPLGYYYGSGKNLRRAYEKYGKENFDRIILRKDILSQEAANYWEVKYIADARANGRAEYNIRDGGTDNYKKGTRARESHRTLTKAWKNWIEVYRSEHKEYFDKRAHERSGLCSKNKHKPCSEERRQKLIDYYASLTTEEKQKRYDSIRGKPGPNRGRKFSEETKKRMSEAGKRRCERMKAEGIPISPWMKTRPAMNKSLNTPWNAYVNFYLSTGDYGYGYKKTYSKNWDETERKLRYQKTSQMQKNKIWITNGECNMRLDKDKEIPEGFRPGRK